MMTKDPVYQLWQLEESAAPGTPAERKPLNDAKNMKEYVILQWNLMSEWLKDKLQSELTPEQCFAWSEILKICTAKHVNQ